MDNFCKEKFIKQEYTVPYNPEQNGMAERMNRTLVEMTRCMLKDSGLDKSYWCEALMTAADIRNVVPNSSNKKSSPYEMLFKRKPRIDHMRVFGSQCYAHVTKEKRKKLDDSGVKCYFLGYAKDHKAYRLLNADDGSIIISRSVTFAEHSISKAMKKREAIELSTSLMMMKIWRRRHLTTMVWRFQQMMKGFGLRHFELAVIRFVVVKTSPVFKVRFPLEHQARPEETAKKSG